MIKLDTSMLLGDGPHRDQARGGKIGGASKGPAQPAAPILDPSMLLGGVSRSDQARGGKIGTPAKEPARAAAFTLDSSMLLGRGAHGQAHGAKIGFKASAITLDPSMLLGEGAHRDQAHGAKIGGGKGGLPAGTAGIVSLDTDKLLGRNGLGQAAGAKIGRVKTDIAAKR